MNKVTLKAENLPAIPDDESIERIPRPPGQSQGLRPLREAIGLASAQAKELAEAGERDTLAYAYVELEQLRKDLGLLCADVEQYVIQTSPSRVNRAGNTAYDPFLVEETAYFEIRRKSSRTAWDSESLLDRVVTAAVIGDGNGELPSEETRRVVDRVLAALKAVVPFTSSLGWRKTSLRDMGIDPTDYSETDPEPGFSIKMTGAHPE